MEFQNTTTTSVSEQTNGHEMSSSSISNSLAETVTPTFSDGLDFSSMASNNTHKGLGLGRHTVIGVVFIALAAVILMVVTVGGNLLVIIAYRSNRRLRSVNNLFLVSLACSDLVIGVVSMNLYPIMMITEYWPFGHIFCDIWLCVDYTLSMASVANLMLICLDRYFSVTRPFTYRSKRTRPRAKVAIVLAWIFSMLLWAPAILIWPRVQDRLAEDGQCQIEFFQNPIITCVTAILAFYLPVLIMIILYWRIFMETRRCRQYLDYLRSYKISNAKSPIVKRAATAQKSAPSSASVKSIGDNSPPRRRINSTPSSSFRTSAMPIWRPDPLQENPDEASCGDVSPCEDRHTENRDLQARVNFTASLSNSSTDMNGVNNNATDGKTTAARLSHFQRLKRTIVGSIRNTFKSSTTDERREKMEESLPDKNYNRRDTESSCCDQSHTLTLSRRSSSGTTPVDKGESCALLQGDTVSPNCNSANSNSVHNKDFVVPIIITTDEESDQRVPCLARRTKSEGDGFKRSRDSLPVPPQKPPAIPRSQSSVEAPTPGQAKMPSTDRKAARTLSAILLAFVVTWLPYNVCVLYSSFCTGKSCEATIPTAVWDFAYYLCYINSTLNPFCYAACNKTFRNTFIRLLTCSKRGNRRRRFRWCWQTRRRDRIGENTFSMQPSTSSSRSVPPSPIFKKRESSST
uniref:muscarinic acetylcholine receptor M2-like isoform X1 n=2 Tax=Styela clava TaxID=7725 RepID=UPI00193A302D|nr:muscarinic acetylcholine receptor M2-like isoform X1 [Styela clava]XP_039258853.1 muscarinic acetylcholine receptor M2-like isoform X1 [Styela clava]